MLFKFKNAKETLVITPVDGGGWVGGQARPVVLGGVCVLREPHSCFRLCFRRAQVLSLGVSVVGGTRTERQATL